MQQNYLLSSALAERLYYEFARPLPLIDYHNHLPVQELAGDKSYGNIAELWLLSDPYKHRAMRICGVPEHYITGQASAKEKFFAWCRIFPQLPGNPLFDWSRMELEWIFQVTIPICEENAERIWQAANEKLCLPSFSAQGLLKQFRVEYAAPCTAACDDLSPYANLPGAAPSLRGDDLAAPTLPLIQKLEMLTGQSVRSFDGYILAIRKRLSVFQGMRCRFSDHALDNGFTYQPEDGRQDGYFSRILSGGSLDQAGQSALRSAILRAVAKEYARLGWTMQLHIGAERHTSTRLRNLAGAAGGYAAIGHPADIGAVVRMLDDMEQSGGLPRTLLFTLNPADHEAMAALSGSYSEDGIPAKVSLGPAWWWCDHQQGMREVFQALANYSVLSTFTGMATDSRNILSMLRHDYYRRVLCSWLGEKVSSGEFPDDYRLLGSIVRKLSYENIANILKGGSSWATNHSKGR